MQTPRQQQPPPETETIILDIENDLMEVVEALAAEKQLTIEALFRQTNRLMLQENEGLINLNSNHSPASRNEDDAPSS